MLLILEIALTVAAWRKGWRFRALVPLASAWVISFLMGASVGLAGGTIDKLAPLLILLELTCTGVLIALASRSPRGAHVLPSVAPLRAIEPPQPAHVVANV